MALQPRIASSWIRLGKRSFHILPALRVPEPVGTSRNPAGSSTAIAAKDGIAGKSASGDKAPAHQSSTGSMSKAMQSYLERAEAHHKFMKQEEEEFVFGRRHLANMMGKDPETFTQRDIEEAIRYLFPACVSVASAKPMMKPPSEIYPKAKAAQFDASGRPHHPFFYTTRPNFYFIVHEVVSKLDALDAIAASPTDSPASDSTFAGTIWLEKVELEDKILERLPDALYEEWVSVMERLAGHERHEREKEFISSYRKPLSTQSLQKNFPPILLNADGRQSVTVEPCRKKVATGSVKVVMPGTGKFAINGKGLDYFPLMREREAIIYPLQLANWLGTVDVEAKVDGAGFMAQAAALRWGVATAIAALGADVEPLRLAGLLTQDRRRRERRHGGCDGARAKWTWKKR